MDMAPCINAREVEGVESGSEIMPVNIQEDSSFLGAQGVLAATSAAAWSHARYKQAALLTALTVLVVFLVAHLGNIPSVHSMFEPPLHSVVSGMEVKVAVGEEAFTCAKYGCLDVRSLNTCQCSRFCVKEGNCCSDYKAICEPWVWRPKQNPRLGPWTGCHPPGSVTPPPGGWAYHAQGQPLEVKVLSYNPEWWHVIEQLGGNGNSVAKVISDASKPRPFDFIGFQEFYDPWFGLTRPGFDASGLLKKYLFIRGEIGGPVGTVIGFRNDTWTLISRGQRFVAEDRKGNTYFGKRMAMWARFAHRSSDKTVFMMNHHGPLPSGTGGVCGGIATATNLLNIVAQNAKLGDAVIFVGDFNAVPGSQTVQLLSTRLPHLFVGIDNVFTNLPATAVVSKGNLASGGSDHPGIAVQLKLPGAVSA